MSMKYIRDAYGIPVKKGMRVRTRRGVIGWVTSANNHINVKFNKYLRESFHPFDLDYLLNVDQWQWLEGKQAELEYNRRLDYWNAEVNRKKTEVGK